MHPCVCVTWNSVPWLHHVWELQSWGPNLCPNQGQREPPACATCLPAPGSTPGTSSHQTLNLRWVSTAFMAIPACIPAAQNEGSYSPQPHWRIPDGTSLYASPYRFPTQNMIVSTALPLSLFEIKAMPAWGMTTVIIGSEPPPSSSISGTFPSLFPFPHLPEAIPRLWWLLSFPATHSSVTTDPFSPPLSPLELSFSGLTDPFSQVITAPFSFSSSLNLYPDTNITELYKK